MRLIDADKLHYHWVWIASIKKGEYNGMKSAVVVFADEIDKNKQARVDAVRVVRCKDCKHRPYPNPNVPFGPSYVSDDEVCPYVCGDPYYNDVPADNSYCDRGER